MMDEKLEPIKEDVKVLKEDVKGLKQDVGALKEDVKGLEQNVEVLKQNLKGLEQNVEVLKQDVDNLKENVEELNKKTVKMSGKIDMLQNRVSDLEFTMENKISHEIHLIAENHFFLNRQLEYIKGVWKKYSELPIKVEYLYYQMQQRMAI